MVELTGPGRASGRVRVARTPGERWRGLRPRPQGWGLLLAGCSVHGRGMRVPLRVASLDAAGRVRRVAWLRPGGLFFDPGAWWVLELPAGRPGPPVGMALRVRGRMGSPVPRGGVCWHT